MSNGRSKKQVSDELKTAKNHRQKLAVMKAKLIDMSIEWEDVDEFFRSRLEQLAEVFNEMDGLFADFIVDENARLVLAQKNKNQLSLLEDESGS